MKKGFLVLETGEILEGTLIGSTDEIKGELVFNTSMTGYQDVLTNSSYAGQIIAFTYPLLGNYGFNIADDCSSKVHVSGVVVGELCAQPSRHTSDQSISEQLQQMGITALVDIDTRALVKLIRKYGTLQARISSSLETVSGNDQEWSEQKEQGQANEWVKQVAVSEAEVYENSGAHVALIDFGYKPSLLQALLKENCQVTVVPYSVSYEQLQEINPDGVIFSNGPGNPLALQDYLAEYREISRHYPTLGIGLGHQVLALAYGAQTQKLKCGHRGTNHPVKELSTGRVLITSQHHGYVVTKESIDDHLLTVTHQNVNDGTIEGLQHKDFPMQTVQFYPETYPVPNDAAYIFTTFIQQLKEIGDMNYALT